MILTAPKMTCASLTQVNLYILHEFLCTIRAFEALYSVETLIFGAFNFI